VQVYDVGHVLDHFERVFDVMLKHKRLNGAPVAVQDGDTDGGESSTLNSGEIDASDACLSKVASIVGTNRAIASSSLDDLSEELLKQMGNQQWDKTKEIAEHLYVHSPHSIYVASVLGQLHAQLGHGNLAHFYWKQVLISTLDPVLHQVAKKHVELVRR